MQNRIEAIDQYRGIAIILMVIANYLFDVTTIPGWLKHAPDIGLTVIDLIAPFFIFAIGLTYGASYRARVERDGAARTWGHFLRRWLALIGIGAIISAGEVLVGKNASPISWGVLQAIGVAGIVTLLVIRVPPLWRALIALVMLAAYQLLLDNLWLSTVLHSEHGGMEGAVAWSAMLILSSVVADVWRRNGSSELGVAWPSAVALAAGLLLSLVAPISKNRVSASYVLVSLGASGLLFAVVQLAVSRLRLPSRVSQVVGNQSAPAVRDALPAACPGGPPGRPLVARAGLHSPCGDAGRGDHSHSECCRVAPLPRRKQPFSL